MLFCPPIIPHHPPTLQSSHASIRREAGRTRALRDHDGRSPRSSCRNDGSGNGRDVAGRSTWRLLPEPAMAGKTGSGYSDRDEEPGGREGIDSECDGGVEEKRLKEFSSGVTSRWSVRLLKKITDCERISS